MAIRPYDKLRNSWGNMKTRCYNKKYNCYKDYGLRGIKVCDEWHDYEVFKNWALENGYKEGLSLERKNNDIGYQPDNCEFIPKGDQSKNRRCVKRYTKDGFTGTLFDWAKRLNKKRSTLAQRLYVYKWDIDKVLT
jgi:hypothetical protein